jgi:hypothetical protein
VANKYLDTYKKRKRKKKEKKLKVKLAKAGYAGVYHPPKKGADPKSIRDIGHMKSKTNTDQENDKYPDRFSKKGKSIIKPNSIKYKKLYKEIKKRRKN